MNKSFQLLIIIIAIQAQTLHVSADFEDKSERRSRSAHASYKAYKDARALAIRAEHEANEYSFLPIDQTVDRYRLQQKPFPQRQPATSGWFRRILGLRKVRVSPSPQDFMAESL